MLKGVIFDLDDTLYDYKTANKIAVDYILMYMADQYQLDDKVVKEAVNHGKKMTKQLLTEGAAQHSRLLYYQHALELLNVSPVGKAWRLECLFWDKFLDRIELYAGVKDVFEWLTEKNIKIGICTDLTAGIQHQKLMKLGLDKYVDALVTSEEIGYEKPDKRMFQQVLDKLKLEAKDVAMVGDSWDKDIQGAAAMGIKSIWKQNNGNGLLQDGIWKFANYQDGYLVNLIKEI